MHIVLITLTKRSTKKVAPTSKNFIELPTNSSEETFAGITLLSLYLSICVCAYEWEVTGSHLMLVKNFLSHHCWTWDVTTDRPLIPLAMAPAATQSKLLQKDDMVESD